MKWNYNNIIYMYIHAYDAFHFCLSFLKAYLQEDWVGFQLLSYALDGKTQAERKKITVFSSTLRISCMWLNC